MGTIVNAVIGAIASVVLAFLPFSTVLGGALSGFLEGEDGRAATVAGALSGLITLLPLAGLGLLGVAALAAWLGVLGVPAGGIAAMVVAVGMLAAAALVYTVGFGAVGGYLGAVLAREYPEGRASFRETIGMDRKTPRRKRYDPSEDASATRVAPDPIDRALADDRERKRAERADRSEGTDHPEQSPHDDHETDRFDS